MKANITIISHGYNVPLMQCDKKRVSPPSLIIGKTSDKPRLGDTSKGPLGSTPQNY